MVKARRRAHLRPKRQRRCSLGFGTCKHAQACAMLPRQAVRLGRLRPESASDLHDRRTTDWWRILVGAWRCHLTRSLMRTFKRSTAGGLPTSKGRMAGEHRRARQASGSDLRAPRRADRAHHTSKTPARPRASAMPAAGRWWRWWQLTNTAAAATSTRTEARPSRVCAGGLKVRREAMDRRLVAWTPHRGPSATKKARLNDLTPIRGIAAPNAVDKHITIQDSWHIANQSHIVCL